MAQTSQLVCRALPIGPVMFDPLSLDPCCVGSSAMDAYFSGAKIDLIVKEVRDSDVLAIPMDPVFQFLTFNCVFPEWVCNHLQTGMNFTVLNFQKKGEGEIITLTGKNEDLLPIVHAQKPGKIAEAFSGLGGWSHGALWCGSSVTMLIESDRAVAEVCGKNHNVQVIGIDAALDMLKHDCIPESFILHASVDDAKVYVIAGLIGISTWLASPPCQPWSRASRQKGLEEEDGAIFGKFMYWLGVARVLCINLENVPGLPKHPHYKTLREIISIAGFDLVLASCDRATPVLPIMRTRWLATCVRKDVHYTDARLAMAQSVAFPQNIPGVGELNSIGAFNCVQYELQDWEVMQCVPNASVLQILSDPKFLPPNLRGKNYLGMPAKDVLALRLKTVRQPLPNVMAAQGSQHELPCDLLAEKGLFSFILNVNECLRFATPFEISSAMGYPATTCFPDDFNQAWHMIGNALAIPHAALQCFRSRVLLEGRSGFGDELKSIKELCQKVLMAKCSLDEFQVVRCDGYMFLRPKVQVARSFPETIIDSSDDEIEVHEDEGPAKKSCLSPTWHCMDEEPTLVPELNRSECPDLLPTTVGTKIVQIGKPFFYEIATEIQELSGDQVLVKLLHSQGFWKAAFVTPVMWSIKEIFHLVLPHAKQEHFDLIEVNGHKAWFGSTPIGTKYLNITFRPFCFARTVVIPLPYSRTCN